MDVVALERWYEYSHARDAMFAATDIPESPWNIVQADDKRRARLNCISHLLSQVPYEGAETVMPELPERDEEEAYDEEAALEHRSIVPEIY